MLILHCGKRLKHYCMDNAAYNDELLVRYLDGELTGADKSSVDQQLAADKQLRQQFESLLLATEAVRYYGLQQKVAAIHTMMMPEMQVPLPSLPGRKKVVRIISAVAAAAILFIAGYWMLSPSNPSADKIFAAQYHTYTLPVTRGAEPASVIGQLYQEKNYTTVLAAIKKTGTATPQSYFLAGSAAMELKDDKTALHYFSMVLDFNETNPSPVYKDETEYYMALAYLRSGDENNASAILERIKNDPAHTYYSEVTDALLEQVRRLAK